MQKLSLKHIWVRFLIGTHNHILSKTYFMNIMRRSIVFSYRFNVIWVISCQNDSVITSIDYFRLDCLSTGKIEILNLVVTWKDNTSRSFFLQYTPYSHTLWSFLKAFCCLSYWFICSLLQLFWCDKLRFEQLLIFMIWGCYSECVARIKNILLHINHDHLFPWIKRFISFTYLNI